MPRSIMVGLLNYTGHPYFQVKDSLMGLMVELMRRGIPFDLRTKCRLPTHMARNQIVADFLASDATDLLMTDDDNYTDAVGYLKLLEAPVDFCAAPVMMRKAGFPWNTCVKAAQPIERDENGLIEVERVGTGIFSLTRSLVDRMVAAEPDNWYRDSRTPFGQAHNLFEYSIVDHEQYGEDMTFCRKWTAIGGKIHVHPDVQTCHIAMSEAVGVFGKALEGAPRRIEMTWPGGQKYEVENRLSTQPNEADSVMERVKRAWGGA